MDERIRDELRRARRVAHLLDNQFRVFGFRFGLDPLLGLIPGLGDLVPAAFSVYLLHLGIRLGLPPAALIVMALNSVLDILLGFIPGLGDVSDVAFKAHSRNVAILERHLTQQGKGETIIEGRARWVG